MFANGADKVGRTLVRAAVVAAAAVAVTGGPGSTAQADEFVLTDSTGQMLRSTRVEIENNRGLRVSTMHTDGNARLVLPHKSGITTYWLVSDTGRAEVRVDGERQLKVVVLQ